MNYWLMVGTPENWKEAFQKGNVWGVRGRQRRLWDNLQESDVALFYAVRPVAGVIGYGTIKTKFRQDRPFWSEEVTKNEVIWPLCFEFDVEDCLPPDKWETDKVTSEVLRFKVGVRSRQVETSFAQEIVSKFKERYISELEEPVSHREIQQRLIEIGKLQNYIAEGEYSFDLGRLDVVWRRIEQSVPTFVFEINVRGDLYHDLTKLKHAYDLWNSRIFIVASQTDSGKVKALLSGSFHEIREQIRFIDLEKIYELYERKKGFLNLEKELGIKT